MEIKIKATIVLTIEYADGSAEDREYDGIWVLKCEDFNKVYDDVFEILNEGSLNDVVTDDERIKDAVLRKGEVTDFLFDEDTATPIIYIWVSAKDIGLE